MPVRPEYYLGATKTSPFYGEPQGMAARAGLSVEKLQTLELPASWLVQTWGGWEGWTPRTWEPRVQGWKIHVSATPRCAAETLARTSRICIDLEVAFKFLPTIAELTDSSAKQGGRGGSGKFITIYPRDDQQLEVLLTRLAEDLRGQEGPYILSDLRFTDDAPVFVRYGAVLGMQKPDEDDNPVECIVEPGTMNLIPDLRTPAFVIPAGVELPEFLRPAHEKSKENCVSRLDEFTSIRPLHFSNAGGVYRAELPSGEVRVLREARPHAGLDARNRCALERQKVEEQVLRDLADVPGVQHLRGVFTAWEHRFLELDYVEGATLTRWVVRNTSLQEADPAEYARQATDIVDQLVAVVERIHARGWALGDLHPGNVLVSSDGTVTVLDLEDATRLDQPREIGFRVFEYCADESVDAEQADWFAVARSIMLLYAADFEIEAVSPAFWDRARTRIGEVYGARAEQQLREVESRYPATTRPVLATDVTAGVPAAPLSVDAAIDALLDGIDWSRQYAAHSAYPGDIATPSPSAHEVFSTGRAGIVWARLRAGAPVADGDVDALRAVARTWRSQEGAGLLDGLAGIALTLAELGHLQDAARAASTALELSSAKRRLDLGSGQAGTILAALQVGAAAQDEELTARALSAYERLHRTVDPEGPARETLCRRRGLHWGLTGVALTDLVAHIVTGRAEYLERARARVRADLDTCQTLAGGEVMVLDSLNNRVLPYTEWGSAGLLLVATAIERLDGRAVLTAEERAGIVRTCSSSFYVYSTLDHGRAGIIATLGAAGEAHRSEEERQVRLLLDSLLVREEGVFAVGDGLIRLSSDLSTGAAGVALALHAHRAAEPYLILPLTRRTTDLLHSRPPASFPDLDVDHLPAQATPTTDLAA